MSKTLNRKITSLGSSGLLNAAVDQTPYGSYAHVYLAVSLRKLGRIGSAEEAEAFVKDTEDSSLVLDAAMESAAASHELRHFHDCFGTISGATLFLNYLSMMREFYRNIHELKRERIDLRLPFHDWASHPDVSVSAKTFSKRCMLSVAARHFFNGAFAIEPQVGAEDRPYAELEVFPNNFVPAFPLQIQHNIVERGVAKSSRIDTHWVPLGFDTLVEGNAHALQLAIFDSAWSGAPTEALEAAQRMHVSFGANKTFVPSDAGPLVLPYRISDLLLSKYLRTQRKIEKFPRGWLTEVTDTALMLASVDEFGSRGRVAFPGGIFVALMEKMEISADGSRITLPTVNDEMLAQFRNGMVSCGPPDNVFDPKDPFSAIEYIARYARHKVIAPLFDLRLKHGNAIFSDLALYAEKIKEFPLPPMMLVGGRYQPGEETDKIFPDAWGQYVMLCEIMGQALRNQNVICCPKAYGLVEGLSSFEFAASPGCDSHVFEMSCGKWSGIGDQDLPKCSFDKLTRHLFQSSGS